MLLDIRTLFFANLLINVMVALMMAIYWRTQKTFSGFGYWALGSVGIAVTFLLFAFKGVISDFYTVVIANTAAMSAAAARHIGVRLFWGKPILGRLRFHIIAVCGCALSLVYYTFVENDPLIRLLVVTACISSYCLIIVVDMTRGIRQGYPIIAKTLGLTYLLYAVTMFGRLLEWSMFPEARHILIPSLASIVYFSSLLLLEVSSALLFMMLNSQRLAKNLWAAQQELENLASIDPLTGLYNRRKLIELGEAEIARTTRGQQPCSLLLIDLDRLKQTNDTFGHSAGDALLLNVVTAIRSQIEENCILGRLGGDEFVLLLPGVSMTEARLVADSIRQAVRSHPFIWENNALAMSVSVGVSEYSRFDAGWTDWLQRADLNLYQEKKKRQNKTG